MGIGIYDFAQKKFWLKFRSSFKVVWRSTLRACDVDAKGSSQHATASSTTACCRAAVRQGTSNTGFRKKTHFFQDFPRFFQNFFEFIKFPKPRDTKKREKNWKSVKNPTKNTVFSTKIWKIPGLRSRFWPSERGGARRFQPRLPSPTAIPPA